MNNLLHFSHPRSIGLLQNLGCKYQIHTSLNRHARRNSKSRFYEVVWLTLNDNSCSAIVFNDSKQLFIYTLPATVFYTIVPTKSNCSNIDRSYILLLPQQKWTTEKFKLFAFVIILALKLSDKGIRGIDLLHFISNANNF